VTGTPAEAASPPAYTMARGGPLELPGQLAEFLRTGPLGRVRLWDGSEVWLVTGWEAARAVLGDRRFSSDLRRPGFPRPRPAFRGDRRTSFAAARGFGGATLLRMDPPHHDVLRRALTGFFTARKVAGMRPLVEGIVGACLDDLEARGAPADIVHVLATPLPSLVICELLGVPVTDRAWFEEQSATMVAADATQRELIHALRVLTEYLDDLVTAKEREPGDDLLGRLIRGPGAGGSLGHGDLVGTARLLLTAGHETTASMLGLGVTALLADRSRWEALLAEPELVPRAVEELLRYHTIGQIGVSRVATADVTVAGRLVRAGEGVIVSIAAANRDPGAFADPDVLWLGRGARHHLAFGFGAHQCLGQGLARLELEVALAGLGRRFPGLRLAGAFEDVEFGHERMIYGVERLWVTW
jgi:cytochrome P450